MRRKRVVLFSILIIISLVLILPVSHSTTSIEVSDSVNLAQDHFTILAPSEPVTWCKDSKVNLVVWTINGTIADEITFDILRDGNLAHSGSAEKLAFLESIPVFYAVPISDLDYGTYNYTIIVTADNETKSGTIILNLVEGVSNPNSGALAFFLFLGGFAILSFAFLFSSFYLKQHLGGMKQVES